MADATKRMNFFDRQFLRAADFQAEQAYSLDRRRRHNRLLHTPGVADGLVVSGTVGASTVQVSPGTAYDASGREIVLATSRQVDISAVTGATAYITIAYQESGSDPSTDPGVTGTSTRIQESPALAAGANPPASPGMTPLLAQASLTNGKLAAVPDSTVRTRAGIILSDDLTVRSLTVRNDSVSSAQWPKLTCPQANQAAISNASLILDSQREVFFQDNAQVRCFDDSHRLVFDRQNNQLELYEFGDILFLTGGAPPTEKVRIRGSGQVGIGTATPNRNLTISGPAGTYVNVIDAKDANGPYEVLVGADTNGGILSTISNHDLQLRAGGNVTRLTIKAAGNIGIGTTSPQFALDVADRLQIRQGPSGTAGLWLTQTVSANPRAFIGMASDGQVGLWGNTGANWGLVMDTTTGFVSIGIGNNKPSRPLHVEGSEVHSGGSGGGFSFANRETGSYVDIPALGQRWVLYASGGIARLWSGVDKISVTLDGHIHAVAFDVSSDVRLKTKIQPLSNVLDILDKIQPVSFEWNESDERFGQVKGRRAIGVLAQDVEPVFPELVSTWDDQGHLGIDYGRLTAVVLEAARELKARNDELERRIAALEEAKG